MYVACIHVYTPQHVDCCQGGSSGSRKFDTSVHYVHASVQNCVLGLQELQTELHLIQNHNM